MKQLISTILVLALFMTSGVGSFASDDTSKNINKEEYKNTEEEYNKSNEAINQVEKYLIRNSDGTFKLPDDIKSKINKEYHEYIPSIIKGMEETNELIHNGEYTSDENFNVTPTKSDVAESKILYGVKNDGYHPRLGLHKYWWGWELGISNAATQNIVDALAVGGGAAGVAAALAAGGIITSIAALPTGVAAGLATMGAGTINAVNRWGGYHGVFFRSLGPINFGYRHK